MVEINAALVKKLINCQFPQWANLDVYPVAKGGHDNRTFHLGTEMMVRLPSGKNYVAQIEKELKWLPRLKPFITLTISSPIAMGEPSTDYPFPWSINLFIEGKTASNERISSMTTFATNLAMFLKELQSIDITDAPKAGQHNFFRGGDLSIYQKQTEKALLKLETLLPSQKLGEIWRRSIQTKWTKDDVWVHGDVALGNLLVKDGALCGVIDFGIMGVGDPACDYVMAWTFFGKESRKVFFKALNCDLDTIDRARGWALWKALITYHDENIEFRENAKFTINAILEEYNDFQY